MLSGPPQGGGGDNRSRWRDYRLREEEGTPILCAVFAPLAVSGWKRLWKVSAFKACTWPVTWAVFEVVESKFWRDCSEVKSFFWLVFPRPYKLAHWLFAATRLSNSKTPDIVPLLCVGYSNVIWMDVLCWSCRKSTVSLQTNQSLGSSH